MTYIPDDPLEVLITAYFGQDHGFDGTTVEEIIAVYSAEGTVANDDHTTRAIQAFIADHPLDLDQAFAERFSFDMDPVLWGYSTRSFLEKVLVLLGEGRTEKLQRKSVQERRDE
jgi:hypothetical protein